MQNRMLRAAAVVAAIGFVTACDTLTPSAISSEAPEVAAPSPDTQAQAPAARREAQKIVIEPGQSLSRIAAKYGVPKQAIIAANNLTPPYKIKYGRSLLIPGDDAAPPGALAPVVAASDKPGSIPLDPPSPPAPAVSPPAVAATSLPPDAPAAKPVEVAAPSANRNPEPLPVPPAPPLAMTSTPPTPAEPPAPIAAAPAPAPAAAAESAPAPPGVICAPGTTGVWSEDVIKKPVYICRRPHSPS